VDLGFSGRTALVLGAGGGLGHAIACTLAKEGAAVAIVDNHRDSLEKTEAAIKSLGGKVVAIDWDIAQSDLAAQHVQSISQQLGGIDILVNNTGGPPPSQATGVASEVWRAQFQSMVMSVIALTDASLPHMRTKNWGRIITSTSSGVVAPIPNLGLSNALRMTLVGWSKTLAREVAPYGITANIVLPGRIATARIQFLDEQKAKRENKPVTDVIAESTSSIPMGRYGTPQEYADTVAFLASTKASYITGSVIRVDGGYIQSI
jgi:3-oxoacyl-[acyl-carrier protein] reductase